MAKKKKEEPKVDNEVGQIKVKEKVEKQPDGNETKGDVTKIKETMKQPVVDLSKETITKVDLNKPPKTEEENETVQEVVEEAPQEQESVKSEDTPVVEEITEEEPIETTVEEVKEAVEAAQEEGIELPENIQKLMEFMDDTGGDLNDYVKLNQDYTEMDNHTVLEEYYKQTKPHLSADEIDFLMEDQFAFDEEEDSEKEIKRKKLALKEQVASARSHLDGQKSKYYDEIKSGSKLTKEQQEAIDFAQEAVKRTQWEQDVNAKFIQKTNRFFGDKFKGFDYSVGEKKFRLNVKDVNQVKEAQSDISNFVSKFVDKDFNILDEAGYHKGLYTAMNPDTIANHFYEQGRADALKDNVTSAKNISMAPRQEMGDHKHDSGIKVRVLGESTNDFKFKIKNNK